MMAASSTTSPPSTTAAAAAAVKDGGGGGGDGLGFPPRLVETFSGLTAGLLSTLTVHPLDLIKTRLQLDRSVGINKFGTSFRLAKSVAKNEGNGFKSLYRGLPVNVLGNMTSWGIFFLVYGELKARLAVGRPDGRLRDTDILATSSCAGLVTALCTNPLWVVKTRMLSTAANTKGAYPSMVQGFRSILRTDGPRGLMRGFVPALFGITHGSFQFMFYEKLKAWKSGGGGSAHGGGGHGGGSTCGGGGHGGGSTCGGGGHGGGGTRGGGGGGTHGGGGGGDEHRLGSKDFLVLSASAKIAAGILTYPYKVIQTRTQSQSRGEHYTGPADVIRKMWQREGVRGFYKGLAPNTARVLPSTMITFLVYENTRAYLG